MRRVLTPTEQLIRQCLGQVSRRALYRMNGPHYDTIGAHVRHGRRLRRDAIERLAAVLGVAPAVVRAVAEQTTAMLRGRS